MEVFERFKGQVAAVQERGAEDVADELRFSHARGDAEGLRRENRQLREERERLVSRIGELEGQLVEKEPCRAEERSPHALTQEKQTFAEKLKVMKRSLGKLVAQNRIVEKRARKAESEREAARLELEHVKKRQRRTDDMSHYVKAYLVQVLKTMSGDGSPCTLEKSRDEMCRAVEDDTLRRMLIGLSKAPSNHQSSTFGRDLPTEEHAMRLKTHFLRLRVKHLRNEMPTMEEIRAAEAEINCNLAHIDQYIQELGDENLRLDLECRRLQLAQL